MVQMETARAFLAWEIMWDRTVMFRVPATPRTVRVKVGHRGQVLVRNVRPPIMEQTVIACVTVAAHATMEFWERGNALLVHGALGEFLVSLALVTPQTEYVRKDLLEMEVASVVLGSIPVQTARCHVPV